MLVCVDELLVGDDKLLVGAAEQIRDCSERENEALSNSFVNDFNLREDDSDMLCGAQRQKLSRKASDHATADSSLSMII